MGLPVHQIEECRRCCSGSKQVTLELQLVGNCYQCSKFYVDRKNARGYNKESVVFSVRGSHIFVFVGKMKSHVFVSAGEMKPILFTNHVWVLVAKPNFCFFLFSSFETKHLVECTTIVDCKHHI